MRVFDFVSFLTYVSLLGFNGYFVKAPSNWEMVLTQIRKTDEIDAADISSQLKILLDALYTFTPKSSEDKSKTRELVRPSIKL